MAVSGGKKGLNVNDFSFVVILIITCYVLILEKGIWLFLKSEQVLMTTLFFSFDFHFIIWTGKFWGEQVKKLWPRLFHGQNTNGEWPKHGFLKYSNYHTKCLRAKNNVKYLFIFFLSQKLKFISSLGNFILLPIEWPFRSFVYLLLLFFFFFWSHLISWRRGWRLKIFDAGNTSRTHRLRKRLFNLDFRRFLAEQRWNWKGKIGMSH